MKTLSRTFATFILASTLVLGVWAGVAALDEFAHLPFHHTLTAITVIVNGCALFVLARRRGGDRALAAVYSRLAAVRLRPRWPAFMRIRLRRRVDAGPALSSPSPSSTRAAASAWEIQNALKKIHSVAWGFPTAPRMPSVIAPEGQINEEVRD